MSHAQQILNASKYSSFSDMAEAWLGDWTMAGISDDDAIELAAKCEEQQQAGDDRDYTEILAEVVAAS